MYMEATDMLRTTMPTRTAGRSARTTRIPGRAAANQARLSSRQLAIEAYHRAEQCDVSNLQQELANRIMVLTGNLVPAEAVYVNREARMAMITVDGMIFRLRHHTLMLLRPCAHCQTGQFESPAIDSLQDIGHALVAWQPYCTHCTPEDPAETESW